MEHMLENWLQAYGPAAYFFILFIEALGAPVPGESGLIFGSIMAAAGKISLIPMLICAFIGSVLGDCTGYAIGRFGGRKLLLRFGHYIKVTPARLKKFEKMIDKRGFYFVMTARFIVILRQLNGLIAGSSGMAFHKFFIANIIGAAAWTLTWGLGPYLIKVLFKGV